MPTRFRLTLTAACLAVLAPAASAVPTETLPPDRLLKRRFAQLEKLEAPLVAVRHSFDICREVPCLTPSEAAALAFQAGPEQPLKGRFILDVRSATGPGNRFKPPGSDEFYLASERDPRLYGTMVVAIAPEAMEGLLNPRTAEAEARIRPTSGRLRAAFSGQRVIVDGEASLQWVDWPDWETGQRNGMGQYQVWIRVTSPDQIRLVEE